MNNRTTIGLAVIIVVLAVVILAGHRLGYFWAGGDGVITPETTELIDVFAATTDSHQADTPLLTWLPGEIITTPADQFFALRTNGPTNAPVFNLDVNSQLKIVKTDGDNITVNLITGRLVIDGRVTVAVRDTSIAVDGITTIVNYSWLDTMDVSVLAGSANIHQGQYSTVVKENHAVSLDTLAPFEEIKPTIFSIDADTVKTFYDWALGR
ncbi:TPA: hypothetical protein DEP96_03315 [Candidatus Uhrbacteria bacterium]|nr:hypothetical protein [Candidatus Uhrbacteria bacterium]